MKKRIIGRLENKKGLTLIETLIVVAIVVILCGILLIGILALIDRINQTKLDNIAQSMYVSAQNRIRELKASGEIDRLSTATELGKVTVKPADWEEDPDDTVDYKDLRYFYHNKDNPANSSSTDLVNFIFPKGSIDEDVLDDNWVIEFDPVTGYVYSAFYSETRSADDYYINNISTLDQSGTSSLRFKDFRRSIKGKNKIGYYGGKANMPLDASGDLINVSMNVINADILKVRMTAVIPSAFDTSDLTFKLTVKGKTSNNKVVLTPAVSSKIDGATKVFSASVILDKLESGQTFKNTFGNPTWQPIYVEPRTGALTPGEDLELSFTVSSNDNSVPDAGPIERTVNSLFESLNPIVPGEVNIAYGRHLQNLDRATSGLPAAAVTSARQISDIDFNDESDKTLPAEKRFLWKSIYGGKTFTPIYNPNLKVYSGYNAVSESASFKIINMHIADNAKPAGLFESFAGNEISGVTMVNEKIDGGTNVGGLVGTTGSNLTIKDCRIYIEKNYFVSGSTYADNILFKGTSNVGGLVGSSAASNITIKDSFAATIIEGTGSIGGLIGSKTNGNAQIQDSYADSYLIGGAATSKIGGLAGELAAGSSISGSYSAGFGIAKSGVTGGQIALAAGFVPNDISSVTNSYSIFDCSESNAVDIYNTAPFAATVSNVYYFGTGNNKLNGSLEYNFTSNAEAVGGFPGSKFSSDDNSNDTYPYNQKTDLALVIYPYLSLTGLPHYGDWAIPAEKPDFGKTGLFYWENVAGGSAPGYQIYLVGRKGEAGSYEAVYHDTINVAHDDGGIVEEYGYGYYVKEKNNGTEYTLEKNDWPDVNKPVGRNTSAESSFNNNGDYIGYKFYCYTTCDKDNPATSYNANISDYMFMTENKQNAAVTLKAEGEAELNYSFCPFFAKSIKLTGWDSWNYAGIKPLLQDEPGTVNNQYKIRSLDQLQFINWNSLSKTNNRMTNDDRRSTFGPYYYKYFPYLHYTTLNGITVSAGNHWFYLGQVEGLSNFTETRKRQNFIQDFDIECIGRTGYSPIAALGETSGLLELDYRFPFFAWFGGNFNGQSYKIKNLSITSGCYSVGVFGVTVGSIIENVVLIGESKDNPPVIKRPEGSPAGYYAIGTLVGMANEYCEGVYSGGVSPYDYVGKIKNCAVAGYEVIDESDQPVHCGETTIGGLAGVLRTNIDRCSAVTTIKINTKNNRGSAVAALNYDDNITVGGIAGTNQTKIYNCYSGGRVIVSESLTKPNIYISGISSSAFTCRTVNMHHDNTWGFISPRYYNCYSYMDLPQPAGNVKVAVIGGDAYYSEYDFKPVLGGELNNCHYYSNNYKIGQMIISGGPAWENRGINSKSYDDMFLEQFCTDLNGGVSPAPYQQVTPYNYSFPCGAATLEGEDYPFAAVITQEHKNNPSDSDGIKYVHYGEWPKLRGLTLHNPEMSLDLISYHEDADNNIINDFSDETEVKYFDSSGQHNILLPNLEIYKDGAWVKFTDNPTVNIDDKVKVSASIVDEVCKLTVTSIDKTEGTEKIALRYLINGRYYKATLSVCVTAVVNLTAEPIMPTAAKVQETVKWNLILKDKKGNLIDPDGMTTGDNWTFSSNPADVFNSSITKAATGSSPFYLSATALKLGEADFEVQALKIKVRDTTNKDSLGNIRTFDSNAVNDLHAICYTGKLILNHYGTNGYISNSYIYKNGNGGIEPDLISTDTDKSYSDLNSDMIAKGSSLSSSSSFAGWYVDVGGVRKKLLNTDGTIFSGEGEIAGITTQDGKFDVDPERDIELYAMWEISYNPLTFVTAYEPPVNTKYLVIAREPRVGANPEYYCMTGDPPGRNKPVTATKVDLQQDAQGNYYLTSPVSKNTMLWEVEGSKRKFKLFNTEYYSYLRNNDGNADFAYSKVVEKTKYKSDKHNLFFGGNRRLLFDNADKKFIFENSNDNIISNQDGGIWLFECDTVTQVRLHEFK
ncbi:MAG: hypothetical protein ACOX75_03910 [Lachnospiraceae bacterium]